MRDGRATRHLRHWQPLLALLLIALALTALLGPSSSTAQAMTLAAVPAPGPGAETIYAVTNPNSVALNVQHVFRNSGGFLYSDTSQVPPNSTVQYHVSQVPQLPSPFTGTVSLTGDHTFSAQVVGYDYPATGGTLTESISLTAGWHLLTLTVHPTSLSPTAVLASLGTNWDIVYGFDPAHGGATSYFADPSKQVFDTLSTMAPLQGYWVHLLAPVTWTVTGQALGSADAIPLLTGWNLIGWVGAANTPVATAFSGLAGGYDIVYGFDQSQGGATSYFPNTLGSPFNTLQAVQPGLGYWVHVTAAVPISWAGK